MDLKLVGIVNNQEVVFPLTPGTHLLGRSDEATFQIPQSSVSRRHAEVVVDGESIVVRDLGSHNGTRINGTRVDGSLPLREGDRLEVANIGLVVQGAQAQTGLTSVNENLKANAEISWDEVRSMRSQEKNLQSLLFRVLAKAGDLLTIPREPREMYEPILDLVETALLNPERVFVLLVENDAEEPAVAARRIHGRGDGGLVLSRTMIRQVLEEKKSFLTSDELQDTAYDGMMSMISQGIRSAIAVPLFDNEDVIGILYADDTRPHRLFSEDQLAAFTLLANIIAVALTHARYHELEEEKRLQDAQLATASEILANIIPPSLPKLDGYTVRANLEPCFAVGGDLYDAQPMADGRYAFLIGDVTGKGLGAALLVSTVLSLTRFLVSEGWEPQPLVTRLNKAIFECTDFVRFTTLFLGYLEPETGRITYVNAGHNPPYVVRADGGIEECPPGGLPVGMMDDSTYRMGETTLQAGDMIALFSDGIPETQRLDDEEYGEETFQEFLAEHRRADPDHMFAVLQEELAEFRGEAPIGDDVTLVTLQRR